MQGSSIELSADGPIRPPYAVYFQGGLTWVHAKLGILMSLQKMVEAGWSIFNAFPFIKFDTRGYKQLCGSGFLSSRCSAGAAPTSFPKSAAREANDKTAHLKMVMAVAS